MGVSYEDFDVLTFDCYGTLIDWESGLVSATRAHLADAVDAFSDEELIAAFAAVEHEAEVPYRTYREVLSLSLRGMGERLGFAVSDAQAAGFGSSVGQWPAFADSSDALQRLQRRFKLAVITNCDDDLFAQSERRLGVSFDYVVTAQQAGSYKPDHANFLLAFSMFLFLSLALVKHVAQSLFHDHVPAKALGMTSIWIDRRQGRGGGASIEVEAHPDAAFPSMAAFADDAVPA